MKGFSKSISKNAELRPQTLRRNLHQELEELKALNLLRSLKCIDSAQGPHITIKGQSFINLSSNDYLNLSNHLRIIKAAKSAMDKYGFGSGASRLLSGTQTSHLRLEKRIAEFKKTPAALVFNTGYAANTGVISALAGEGDVIFSDELNHASIVDGIRLSKASLEIYRHKDADHLESLLIKHTKKKSIKRVLIITDTIFSMDGDIAPLKDLVILSKKHDALLMIDDAHGTGVLGKSGRGGLEHFGIKAGDIIQMGTLSKAAGCFGAFVAGSRDLINVLINRSRSFIYSTSLPPAVCEAAIEAIDIMESRSGALRHRLQKNSDRLRNGLNELGFNTLKSETPIIPILAGDADTALKLGKKLYSNNIFAPAIRPPTVPEGKCRIRFSVTAAHSYNDIDIVLECLGKL